MLRSKKSRVATAVATAAVSLAVAGPASAQVQDGLVNVNIADNIVQVPVAVAANICDVNVLILSAGTDLNGSDPGQCTADAESLAQGRSNNDQGGPPTQQSGLINVNVEDNLVQVPVSVAANICDVNVALLSQGIDANGPAAGQCTANADTIASPGSGGANARDKKA